MAKTQNIADLSTIAANSASILGKTPSNAVGYLTGLLDENGKIAGMDGIKEQITQLEALKEQFTQLSESLNTLETTVDGIDEQTATAITQAFNDRITIKGATGTSYMNNESTGGIMKFIANDGSVGKVTLYDGSDDKQTFIQITSHNADKSQIARLNFNVTGAYYTVNDANVIAEDNMLATKGDVKTVSLSIDQTYKPTSENAQSGKAVAEAFKQHEVITSGNGTAYMANESNGGLIKFTATDGTMSKITLFDGSDGEHTLIQLIAHNADKSTAARLHFTASGTYYSTATSGSVAIPDNELVVKKDISVFALESDLTEHTSNLDIHVTTDDKANWSDKYTKAEVDAKEKAMDEKKADKTVVEAIEEKIPAEASAENQLADKAFVADAIKRNAAHFRGSWNTFAEVPTDPTQYPKDTDGVTTPSKNDYLVVIKDETRDSGTWEYRYTGTWESNGKDGWEALYEISTSPLTPAQLAALDSGITSALVQQIPLKADKTELENYVLKEVSGDTGAGHVNNAATGSGVDFVASDGTTSSVAVARGNAQLVAHNQDKSKGAFLQATTDGLYYTKDSISFTAENEVVVKHDLDTLAENQALNAHINNKDIHVTTDDKANWADKYSKTETDDKLATKADLTEFTELSEVVDETKNKVEAEILKNLTTEANLATHMANDNVHFSFQERETLINRVTALEAKVQELEQQITALQGS